MSGWRAVQLSERVLDLTENHLSERKGYPAGEGKGLYDGIRLYCNRILPGLYVPSWSDLQKLQQNVQ